MTPGSPDWRHVSTVGIRLLNSMFNNHNDNVITGSYGYQVAFFGAVDDAYAFEMSTIDN